MNAQLAYDDGIRGLQPLPSGLQGQVVGQSLLDQRVERRVIEGGPPALRRDGVTRTTELLGKLQVRPHQLGVRPTARQGDERDDRHSQDQPTPAVGRDLERRLMD